MKVVKIRSPFIIEINEPTQIGSRVELFIWNKGTSEPAVANYILSKNIASTTQTNTSYNVSNFVKEFIDHTKATLVNVPTIDENETWVYFKVKRYWNNAGTYVLLDTETYIGVNGFTNFTDGVNAIAEAIQPTPAVFLSNPNIITNYYSGNPFINVICEKEEIEFNFSVSYYTKASVLIETKTILPFGTPDETYNYKIPFRSLLSTEDYQIMVLQYEESIFSKATNRITECKYTPMVCSFINRYGGWEFLTFFKAQANSINVSSTSYKTNPSSVDYSIYKGQSKQFNINGTQTVKLNTGFVDENYLELIADLLLSETVLLDDKPVKVKTQGSDLKQSIKGLINYEIEFEYNYDLINNVI